MAIYDDGFFWNNPTFGVVAQCTPVKGHIIWHHPLYEEKYNQKHNIHKKEMTSGDNGSSSGTPASPIQPMVVLEETPPPIVVAREMPDKGDLVVTVEPPGRQQQTAGKEHFPSAVVQTTVILAQTLQPSATPPTAKPPVPPLQPVPVQLTMHPPPFFKTPPMGQMATTQPIISQMPPLFNPMAREQQVTLQTMSPLPPAASTQSTFHTLSITQTPLEAQATPLMPPLA
ncbi:proline-rich receptor-like protein kinase PERK8 [Lactuca sativa]|uniref:proline-rich receptor-like protein kinase PERK8 n=1 Tax=Lactuca sativa TaxID=4236 RepID=UPI000CD9D63B|nr:proline-rich receptor-like protein kinase PERK8 [Lactuca sativa]